MNLFLLLGAMGLSHSLFGARLLPIGTLYDPFIARGLDALNYACYQDARFILVATPSGMALAPEGGAHQSIGTPLIGMAQPGLTSYEPAYADELAVILRWAFEHIQARWRRGRFGLSASFDARAGSTRARADAGSGARHHRWRLLALAPRAEHARRSRLSGNGERGSDYGCRTDVGGSPRASACWRSHRPTGFIRIGVAASITGMTDASPRPRM